MKNTLIILTILSAIMSSCSTTKINNQPYYIVTEGQIHLGDIVDMSLDNPENSIKVKTTFIEAIELNYTFRELDRKSNKIVQNTFTSLGRTVDFTYRDSLSNKANYLLLSIAENLKLANLLNNNKTAKTYLSKSKDAGIVTQIALQFPQQDIYKIKQSTRLFIKDSKKTGALLILEINGKKESIPLSKAVVFAWRISKTCWYFDESKYKHFIGDLIPEGGKCNDKMNKLPKEKKQEFDF